MIADHETNVIFVADTLKRRFPDVYQGLSSILGGHGIPLRTIPGAKQVWCRDYMPIQVGEETIRFPWFQRTDGDHAQVYAALVSLLCKAALQKKRVTAKEKAVPENAKYTLRCFLLSIGMIGDEYKTARKILLSNLSGSSAWKDGQRKEAADDDLSR